MLLLRSYALRSLVLLAVSAPVLAQSADDALLKAAVGEYAQHSEPDVLVAVRLSGSALTLEGERARRVALKPEGSGFTTENGNQAVDFTRDASGKVTGLTVARGNMHVAYDKIGDAPVTVSHYRPYIRTEAMIPARDGVKLHVVILRPEGSEKSGEPLPVLMSRTPYGAGGSADMVNGSKPELAASGYIFVYADIRGRYGSEGQFVMNRPVVHKYGDHADPKLVDESTDTYDTVEWLVKNLPNNNGRVGVLGVSYPGFLAMMAGVDHHPAVKAISPQAPMTDVWMGDDFFHNGAFRETYGFDYVQQLERAKDDQRVSMNDDLFEWFLKNRNFEGAAKAAGMDHLPTAKAFLTQPSYTKFWQEMAVQARLTQIEVPTLEVGGWWDQEDMWGTQAEYAALRPHDSKKDKQHVVFMVLGPWNHGGWGATSRHLGAVDFGAPAGDQYRKTLEAPFFEFYLKDKPGFDLKDTASFRTGEDQWHRYDVWPPKTGFKTAKLYLAPQKSVSFTAPKGDDKSSVVTYVADPANPVPYRARPIQSTYGNGSKWRQWLVEDQRFVTGRNDTAVFQSPVLDKDTTITGDIVADLFASTTGSDADWVVKLIDVYPDDAPAPMAGYQLMIVDEIFRGCYNKSFEKPEAIAPNHVAEFKWSLHGADHTFKKGHRIMVQVQSSWFPLYDRNPQTFVENIMTAPADAYKPQTQSIYFSAAHPSHLEVLVPAE